MERLLLASSQFPVRLSRRLSIAQAVVLVTLLAAGGLVVFLAVRIHNTSTLIRQEYTHALSVDALHLTFHSAIAELEQLLLTDDADRLQRLYVLRSALDRTLATVLAQRADEPVPTLPAREDQQLAELQRLVSELGSLMDRLASGSSAAHIPFGSTERLRGLSERGAAVATQIVNTHQERVGELLTHGEQRLHIIITIYLVLLGVGVVAVGLAGYIGTRWITTPLHRLAHAARSIAAGRLDVRVPATSRDEIGMLSHAFNSMAERLQDRERELALAQDQLRQKISEAHALYQIAGEISRLTRVEPTLRWVVTTSRELLGVDAALLCLLSPEGDELVVRAHSGPQVRLSLSGAQPPRIPLVGPNADVCAAAQAIWEPEGFRGCLTVPLRRGNAVIGVLTIASVAPRSFTVDEHSVVSGLAAHAALVIDNARLYAEMRSVAAREERMRLSREIHDGLAQTLGMLHLMIRDLQDRFAKTGAFATAITLVEELAAMAESAYDQARESITALRAVASDSRGFISVLSEYLHDFGALCSLNVSLDAKDHDPIAVPPPAEVQVIRIVQEALHNVRRHASATNVWVRVRKDGDSLCVTVEDDGRGWDLDHTQARRGKHFGLQTMRERAEGLGGTLRIDTRPGKGARVTATVPLEVVA